MTIEFENASLKELYCTGCTQDKIYKKIPKDIVRRYIKTIDYLKMAKRIENLYTMKSLHYEKKKGSLKDIEAVWINDKYRLLFCSKPDNDNILSIILITEISKHYE